MIEIPLERIPNQEFFIILGGQNVVLHVYERGGADADRSERRMYMDVSIGATVIQQAVPLLPRVGLLSTPKKFIGQFRLVDSGAKPDWQTKPIYEDIGLRASGNRYQLYYLSEEEEAEIQAAYQEKGISRAMASLASGTATVLDSPVTTDEDEA